MKYGLYFLVHIVTQSIAMPMGNVILPCAVGSLELLRRQLSGSDQLRHADKFSLGIALILVLELADGFSIRRDVGMKAKETDAVFEWKDLRLSV